MGIDLAPVLLSSLLQVLAWPAIGFLLLGLLLGFWVGLLPGLGGTTALALMLPFVFGLEPLHAFVLLLAMHSVCSTTGDITSTLFAVPGEGISAAVVLDGYPLAQQGQAGRALGVVLFSSLLGAIVGALALALAIPFVRPLVLGFGPPELFMLSLVGLSYVASLSGRSTVRGLLMAGAGLLLATVGQDPATARLRFTFGEPYLFEGLSLIPITTGLFAVPAVVLLMARPADLPPTAAPLDSPLRGVRDTLERWRLTVRSSLIGVWVGLLPGLGGSVAQWIAYGQAQQLSREREQFGHGSIDGLIAASAVNNSKEGGSLVPTVAFGIPGSSAMAILLGAFIVTGLAPGPEMLGPHLNVTFGMVWTIVLANLLTVGLCFLFIRQLARIARLPGRLLAPFLLLLLSVGAYSANASPLDLLVLLIFGAVGLAAVRWGWPAPPLLLGLVLGPILERNYFLAYSLSGYAWLGRPVVLLLLLLIVVGLLWPRLGARRGRDLTSVAALRSAVRFGPAERLGAGRERALLSLLMLALAATAVLQIWDAPPRPRHFPLLVALPILALALWQLGRDLLVRPAGSGPAASDLTLTGPPTGPSQARPALAWLAIFFLALWALGFVLAIPLYTLAYLRLAARASLPLALGLAALAGAFFWLVFVQAFRLPLFQGALLALR